MTQHEYVFVAVSIILGLAITRLLHHVAILVRVHTRVTFQWPTAIWALSVMAFILQFWWVGWGLREVEEWGFVDFLILVLGGIFIYGASEMALPVPDDDGDDDELDFPRHSEGFGRLSALSMAIYLCIGPYVNLAIAQTTAPLPLILAIPAIGIAITVLMIFVPRAFTWLSPMFAVYSVVVLWLTA